MDEQAKLSLRRAYKKAMKMRSIQAQIKISCMGKFGIIGEEADLLEMLFLPFVIFPGFMDWEDVYRCVELSIRMHSDGILPIEEKLYMLRGVIESAKRNGKHNSLNKYLEKVFWDKLWFRMWMLDGSEIFTELLPFDQQLTLLEEEGKGFL